MGRINRRIYATRRRRSPIKLGVDPNAGPGQTYSDYVRGGAYNNWGPRSDVGRPGAPQYTKSTTQTQQPSYLNETGGDELGIGGGKTYTITEV